MRKGKMMGKIFGIALVLVMVAAMLPLGSFSSQSQALAQDSEYESLSPEFAEQLAEIYQQKQALTPVQRKIDWHILQVVREVEQRIAAAQFGETPKFRDLSTPLLKIDDGGNIEVKLNVTSLADEQLEQLQDLGMNIGITLPKYGVIEGSLPYDQVEAVAGLDFVVNVGTPGHPLYNTGDVTSAGDTVLRAAEARAVFGVDGSGIKVGVMSDGVSHLSNSVATGDLPSSPAVDVLQVGSGDEGTAMLEIIHDLAPGAPLAFYAPDTSSDMVAGIGALETAGCKVIVDDLTFADEPKFEDGPIALEARQFCADGGVYITSAGNSAQEHYIHQYVRSTGSPGAGYPYAHIYTGTDIGNTFAMPNGGTIKTFLQWNNRWGHSGDDFDLILVNSSTSTVLTASQNDQESGAYPDPRECIYWENTTGSSVSVFIAVLEWSLVSPPSSLILDYHVWDLPSLLQYSMPENSVIGHAAVEEVLSTAAADAATPNTIEDFSSRGPGTVYFPTYEERQVPNITGVDGVQTKTGQLGYFYDPFYGTSASAPHVAAIAALVWEAEPTLTSSEVFDAITGTAVDLGSVGYDYTWGFGRVDAYEALESIAAMALSVTTSAATLVEESTATLNGEIADDGGEACQYHFEYDTNSGEPYAHHTGWTGSKTSGQSFSEAISGLSKGTKYYFRAQAKNSGGTASGSELTFLTKPDAPTSFTASTAGTTQIDLSWTKGTGAQKTKIQRKQGGYPANKDDGTQVYFGTATGKSDAGLVPSTTYYYRAWSYAQGSEQWSDNYAQASATTTAGAEPVITVSPTSFEKTLPPDTSKDYTLTISNDGDADLSYDISDVDKGGVAAPAPAGDRMPNSPTEQNTKGPNDILVQIPSASEPASLQRSFDAGYDDALKYDDGIADQVIRWVEGGEASLAVRFTPLSYPSSLQTVWIHLDSGTHAQFMIEVWDDAGADGYPGTILGSTTTTATNWGWSSIDISGMGIIIPSGDFYVAYLQMADSPNCEFISVDLTDCASRSWVYDIDWAVWYPAEDYFYSWDPNWMIRCQVDDVGDCPWLSTSPDSGTVAASGSDDITVSFDTTGLAEGDYSADIVIASNDPDENPKIVPVTLHVTDEAVMKGDANGDGVVNSLDITKVERIIVGLDAETPGADANGDGVVNSLDITKVERIIVGLD